MHHTDVKPHAEPSRRTFYAASVGLAFLAYASVFLYMGYSATNALQATFTTVSSLFAVAALAHQLIARYLVKLGPVSQCIGHAVLAAGFAFAWYWLLMVAIGLTGSASPIDFDVRPVFHAPAVEWQLLQGLTMYAAVASLTYNLIRPTVPDLPLVGDLQSRSPPASIPSRYFVRDGEDFRPLQIAEIVSIAGADDYSEVVTLSARRLVRMRLAQFEDMLGDGNFVRVHRSYIVNIDRIARAEPAGRGRILLIMENGDTLCTSQKGARLLRSRVI